MALRISIVLILLAAVLAAPFVFQPEGAERKLHGAPGDRLVIITPHNESIQAEFGRAFAAHMREKHGREIFVDWRQPGGTTEIAIISLNGIVFSKSIRVAGDELDAAMVNYMKRAYNLLIGERTAEEIKMRVGSAYPLDEELTMEVKGRDSVAGLPKTIHITSQEIREALADTISSIVDAVRVTLERCPPELSADLVDRGFVMAGGGALIRGIDKLLSEKTGLPVTISDDPLSAVANGTGAVLNDLSWLMQNV